VKHEIQVIAPVQGLHGILRFIVPALCVTDYGKPDFLFSVSSRFNPFDDKKEEATSLSGSLFFYVRLFGILVQSGGFRKLDDLFPIFS
jgi:hypothetical protein